MLDHSQHPHDPRTILAFGGGGFSMEPDNPLLDTWVLSVARERGRERPRILYVPTASGDRAEGIVGFYARFSTLPCEPSHLALFRRTIDDLRGHVLEQDVVYVGGGNTANMLAIWRMHGFDAVLREAWQAGVVMCGLSAGSLCWFECGVTDSFGAGLAPLHDGLGLLPGSHCPHYDGEPLRQPRYRSYVGAGVLPPGLALDDGAAARFSGTRLVECVSSRRAARALRVTPEGETPIAVRYLG